MFRRAAAWLRSLSGPKAALVTVLLGALCALALPPLHFVPALFIAFPALLVRLDMARSSRTAAWSGWQFGFGLHVVGLYWITDAILIEATRFWWLVPFAVPGLAAVLAVFVAGATALATRARRGWPRAITLVGAWVLLDLARQFVATGFPWNLLGSAWAFPGPVGDIFIQPAAWISIHGLTILALLVAASLGLGWRWHLAGAALLVGWAGFGLVRLKTLPPVAPGVNVVLVQGNVAQGQKWDRTVAVEIFRHYLQLTEDGLAKAGPGPAVVVWPETASPFQLASDAPARQAITAATKGVPALVGAVRFDSDDRPRNTLFALNGNGAIAALYDKAHLVPFGEYQPDWLPLGIQVVPGGGFASGPGPRTLQIPGLPPVGALICYEAIFPGQVVDPTERPTWLVNITNDAWFGDSAGPRQHLSAARLRAVEQGLPLMRAANTGISAGFDAYGRELERLGMRQAGTLVMALPGALPPTVFSLFGLALPGVLAVALVVLGVSRAK